MTNATTDLYQDMPQESNSNFTYLLRQFPVILLEGGEEALSCQFFVFGPRSERPIPHQSDELLNLTGIESGSLKAIQVDKCLAYSGEGNDVGDGRILIYKSFRLSKSFLLLGRRGRCCENKSPQCLPRRSLVSPRLCPPWGGRFSHECSLPSPLSLSVWCIAVGLVLYSWLQGHRIPTDTFAPPRTSSALPRVVHATASHIKLGSGLLQYGTVPYGCVEHPHELPC